MANIKPIGGYILVKPEDGNDNTTASGLIIQNSSKGERPQKGMIISLGTGLVNEDGEKLPFNVSVGDKILFKKYSPEEVEIDGDTYLIMKEADILGVILDK